MAQKDADLATDYARRDLFLVREKAALSVSLYKPAAEVQQPQELFLVTGLSAALTYRMRGIDGTLGRTVYWNSTVIDDVGADYAGPGPLTDVVISEKTC